ncbi:sigma-E factor negative regulatory protein [Pseudoduganella armeniaca]|uniref:sigma-E factor negative regulatory protein n=1 Tax=Pseudoduganella armeniaca TaxID=2072590 RepID=UPI0015E783F7|nr:sigma-E factor negative regulatory protein [Pseudoduganella armeniaca]
MNTTRLQENISALTDGELPACDLELTMAALADPQGRAAWEAYRLIGDVLRADAAGVEPAPGLAARLAARLAAEPWPDDAREPGAVGEAAAGADGAAVRGAGTDDARIDHAAAPDGTAGATGAVQVGAHGGVPAARQPCRQRPMARRWRGKWPCNILQQSPTRTRVFPS